MAGTITANPVLERLGIEQVNSGACGRDWIATSGTATIASINPADGQEIARVRLASAKDYDQVVAEADQDRWV